MDVGHLLARDLLDDQRPVIGGEHQPLALVIGASDGGAASQSDLQGKTQLLRDLPQHLVNPQAPQGCLECTPGSPGPPR